MKTYEYSIERIDVRDESDFVGNLDDMGKAGWELVQIITPITSETYFARAVFKREISQYAC